MKKIVISLLMFALPALAQEASLKVDQIDGSEDTTISIKKGKQTTDNQFQIVDDSDELSGDPAPLKKDARANWKKACDEWKKELKEMNSENKILQMNCGNPQCVTSAMETVCTSKTKQKIKTKVN